MGESKWAAGAITGRVDRHRLRRTRGMLERYSRPLVIPHFHSSCGEPYGYRGRYILLHFCAQVLAVDLRNRAGSAQIDAYLSIAALHQST
jgi:hypothetical protein